MNLSIKRKENQTNSFCCWKWTQKKKSNVYKTWLKFVSLFFFFSTQFWSIDSKNQFMFSYFVPILFSFISISIYNIGFIRITLFYIWSSKLIPIVPLYNNNNNILIQLLSFDTLLNIFYILNHYSLFFTICLPILTATWINFLWRWWFIFFLCCSLFNHSCSVIYSLFGFFFFILWILFLFHFFFGCYLLLN